jgi:hypothetical protein
MGQNAAREGGVKFGRCCLSSAMGQARRRGLKPQAEARMAKIAVTIAKKARTALAIAVISPDRSTDMGEAYAVLQTCAQRIRLRRGG